MSIPETISYDDAAKRWGVDRALIKREIGKGNIVAFRPGKRVHISVESGDKWFLESKSRAQESAKRSPIKRRKKS